MYVYLKIQLIFDRQVLLCALMTSELQSDALTQQVSNRARNRGVNTQAWVLPCQKSATVNVAAVCT